ncbi:MAG TPA: hypothetical protein VN516_09430 [Candidatus Baltobacteraceae bacterium]|nr:hypothetical protein [Candidatus Baltobacteraceae bacterium]
MTDETKSWWETLTRKEKDQIVSWFLDNPPPKGFRGSKIDWARLECPRGFLTGRFGCII